MTRRDKGAAARATEHIGDLVPDPRNARRHTPRNVGIIADALREVGAARSIVIDENNVVLAGNATIDAAAEVGITRLKVVEADGEEIVAVRRSGLTAEAKTRLALFDNRAAELAEWDERVLAELRDEGATEGLFTDEEVAALVAAAEHEQIEGAGGDEFDATPEDGPTRVQPGDLWQMGAHRLLCGDATSAEDHERVLGGDSVALVLTDPPYGVGVDYGSFEDNAQEVALLIAGVMPLLLRHGRILLTPGTPAMWDYPRPDWLLAWLHPASTSSGPWGFNGLNPILAYGKDPYLQEGLGRRADHVVLAVDARGVDGHPVPKPLVAWTWLLERGSIHEGDVIFDPFLGSGTTLIACERTGRVCRGIEIEPRYCDVILRRWEAETGLVAERLESAVGVAP